MTPNLWPKGQLGRAVEVGMTTSHCAYFCVREKKNNLLVQAFLQYAKTIVYVVLSILSGPVYIGFAFDNVVKVVDQDLVMGLGCL